MVAKFQLPVFTGKVGNRRDALKGFSNTLIKKPAVRLFLNLEKIKLRQVPGGRFPVNSVFGFIRACHDVKKKQKKRV
jgi:hypothetical protein